MGHVRTVIFKPYLDPAMPRFRLVISDTGLTWGCDGKTRLAYTLSMHQGRKTIIFEGSDFYASPLHAIDSDEVVKALMDFLTLREGDVEADYFAKYTPEQLAFRDRHAEALSCEVYGRFGDE